LVCDGSAISRSTYAALFAVIGTTYGIGNGASTFNIPDMRGRTPVGSGAGAGLTNRSLGASGGAETHTLSVSEMPSHTHAGTTNSSGVHSHSITDPQHTHTQTTINDDFNNSGGTGPSFSADSAGSRTWTNINSAATGIIINNSEAHTHTFTTDSTGGSDSHNNMQPFMVVNYIIKY
jgi:microcystin-dependent protein